MAQSLKIEVSILKDVATVMIDTSGSSLSNEVIVLKKVVLLLKRTWQRRFCNYQIGIQINLDCPTQGSGTCIEAAMDAS